MVYFRDGICLRVPRIVVQDLFKEIDPGGTELKKAHHLRRREYHNPGPNYAWHMDVYKLKPWRFPIHGARDGLSCKIIWFSVICFNNSCNDIAQFYLKSIENLNVCPAEMVADLGTENGCYSDNHHTHWYVPSTRNKGIEGLRFLFSKNCSNWWQNFFSNLESSEQIDLSYVLSNECVWYP